MYDVLKRNQIEARWSEGTKINAHITVRGWLRGTRAPGERSGGLHDIWRIRTYPHVRSPMLMLDQPLAFAAAVHAITRGGHDHDARACCALVHARQARRKRLPEGRVPGGAERRRGRQVKRDRAVSKVVVKRIEAGTILSDSDPSENVVEARWRVILKYGGRVEVEFELPVQKLISIQRCI